MRGPTFFHSRGNLVGHRHYVRAPRGLDGGVSIGFVLTSMHLAVHLATNGETRRRCYQYVSLSCNECDAITRLHQDTRVCHFAPQSSSLGTFAAWASSGIYQR